MLVTWPLTASGDCSLTSVSIARFRFHLANKIMKGVNALLWFMSENLDLRMTSQYMTLNIVNNARQ